MLSALLTFLDIGSKTAGLQATRLPFFRIQLNLNLIDQERMKPVSDFHWLESVL